MSAKYEFPAVTPLVASLPSTVPFTGPESIERKTGRLFRARLGANENGFGPAPSVINALQQSNSEVWKYGDPENYDLINALATLYGLKPDQLTVGPGVDSLLGLIVRQYIEHETGDIAIDSLVSSKKISNFSNLRVDATMRGTGCTLSTAIACGIANGGSLEDAVKTAKNYVYQLLLERAVPFSKS